MTPTFERAVRIIMTYSQTQQDKLLAPEIVARALQREGLLMPDQKWEYAVQERHLFRWLFLTPSVYTTLNPLYASWYKAEDEANVVASLEPDRRIVRRTVGTVEVCK